MQNSLIRSGATAILLTIAAFAIIIYRIHITDQVRFLFLIWNLFLAGLPLVVATVIQKHKQTHSTLWMSILIWVILFPNAPYILTDFIHLKYSSPQNFWFDVSMIFYFAMVGLFFGIQSLALVHNTICSKYSNYIAWATTLLVIPLASIGIYIGRFYRWNSWDIFKHPFDIFLDILNILTHPFQNQFAWKFSLLFSTIILISFLFYQKGIDYAKSKKII